MTPEEEELERQRAEEEAAAAEPPAAEPPDASTPAPSSSAPANPLAALLANRPAPEPAPQFDLPPPPQKRAPAEGPAVLGTVLDVLLNRGRNLPKMLAQYGGDQQDATNYENWKRNKDYATSKYALTAPRRYGVGGVDPAILALRQGELDARSKSIDLQKQGVQIRGAAQKTREKGQAREIGVDDPRTKTTRDYLYAHGAQPGTLEGLDYKALQQLMPSVRQDVLTRAGSPIEAQDVQHAGRKAESVSNAQQPNKLELARTQADIMNPYREETQRMEREKLARSNAESFNKEAGPWVQSLNLINEFDRLNPEGKPITGTGVLEGRKPDMLANEDQMKTRQNLRLLREVYARQRSGAAISLSETDNFKVQTGTDEHATDAQIRTALGVLKRWMQDNVRALSVGREDAAQQVMGAQGVSMPPAPNAAPASLGVTPSAGPKVDHVTGAKKPTGGRLVLPDGSSAADTPANRAKLKQANLGFEVQ